MLFQIKKTFLEKGYKLFTRPFELNIVGIRHKACLTDDFDDLIAVACKCDDDQWRCYSFSATTRPGQYWLKTPVNPAGAALLKPGQYIGSYQLGMHRNKYRALIQTKPVTVIRDNNRDETPDFDAAAEQTGLFGINIHHAAKEGITSKIGKYSAGCQVLASIADFNLLMNLAEKHRTRYGNNFTYTLLRESELSL